VQTTAPPNLDAYVIEKIDEIADSNQDFKEAYETYVQQYGQGKVRFSEPTDLEGSIDPVAVVLGRNCIVTYNDSLKELRGSVGLAHLEPGELYIIGRREPQDSKLVAWNVKGGVELQEYNSRVDTIPSRVHGFIANLENGSTVYGDLGSSAGTELVGQSPLFGGAFVRIYDPGVQKANSIRLQRIFTSGP
jgi:hypothetical protein